MNTKGKIGFSEIGGIYLGKSIQSSPHQHYAIAAILSLENDFAIRTAQETYFQCQAAIIQKNIEYSIDTNDSDVVAFFHFVPHSPFGQQLYNPQPIQVFSRDHFAQPLKMLADWSDSAENSASEVVRLITAVADSVPTQHKEAPGYDPRILKSLDYIDQNQKEKLSIDEVAWAVDLSPSHYARLLKKDTGLTFREYLLHSKLVKSLYAMYQENELTTSAFAGGFADQPHFTRTFKNTFGIKPSASRK